MSSTTSTWRPSMLMSRSLRMRTTPDESVAVAVARDGHEVDLARHGQVAHQVGHEEDGALEHADEQQVAALVVLGDLVAELGDARGERRPGRSGPRRPPRSSSVWLTRAPPSHPGASTSPGTATTSSPADDERPGLAFGARDLRVDEHVLHLLAAPGEPVARAPASYLKAWELGFDRPRAPADRALERDGRLLEPDAVVLAHGREALAEVDAARALSRGEQQVELATAARSARRSRFALGARVQAAQQRQDLVADQAAARVRVRGVTRNSRPSARQ